MTMGNFNRDDNRGGGYRGGFSRGGGRGGFGGGRSSFSEDRGRREMFKTICSNCGKECEVPFRPTNGKPVYCSDCFEKMGNGGRGDSRRFDDRDRAPQAHGGPDLGAINAKLDKILNILEPKVVAPVISAPVVKEEKTKGPEPVERIADKVDLPKIKKAVKKIASAKKK
jgi:CxxC-x17-CxxC domain-containing protein